MSVRIANREDPDQTKKQSDLGLRCLSCPWWQATIVQNFRTSTVSFFLLLLLNVWQVSSPEL